MLVPVPVPVLVSVHAPVNLPDAELGPVPLLVLKLEPEPKHLSVTDACTFANACAFAFACV